MARYPRMLIFLAGLLCLCAALLFIFRKQSPNVRGQEEQSKAQAAADTKSRITSPLPSGKTLPEIPSLAESTPEPSILAYIDTALAEFQTAPDAAQARVILTKLRDALRGVPEEDAATAVLAFLKSGKDAATQLPFIVGPDGMMNDVPTLRLALLDLLPSLDPTAALEYARILLDAPTTPDEYALSLRNLAWNDMDGDLKAELSSRFTQLLKTQPWLDQPSNGVLEAFDIAVEIGGPSILAELSDLASSATVANNLPLSRAAYMSMDRLVLRDPNLLNGALNENSQWLDFAPKQRAALLSRLDLSKPAQQDLFIKYLSSTNHGEGELAYFSELFPNGNFLHGHRLVTADDPALSIAQVTAADAAVLTTLKNLESKLPPQAGPVILRIRERLTRPALK